MCLYKRFLSNLADKCTLQGTPADGPLVRFRFRYGCLSVVWTLCVTALLHKECCFSKQMKLVLGSIVILTVLHMLQRINENQNLLLKLACDHFTIVVTDGRRESYPKTFCHYNNDVVRALDTMRDVSLSKTVLPCSANLRHLNGDRMKEFTGFVNSSISYLETLESSAPLRVSIVTNVRHHLSNPNAPGNFLRLARFVYDPSMSAHVNASTCRQCISHEKHKK